MIAKLYEKRALIACICCSPLLLTLLLNFCELVVLLLPDSFGKYGISEILFPVTFLAYLTLPSLPGIIYLIVCGLATSWAWLGGPHESRALNTLVVSSAAILFGAAYDILWFATDQRIFYP